MSKIMYRRVVAAVAVMVAVLAGSAVSQNSIRSSLFATADSALARADRAQADILSPEHYGDAMKAYTEAGKDLEKGRNLDDIRKKLQKAVVAFGKAVDASKLARVTFDTALGARSDAGGADAAKYAAEAWQEGEERFREAAAKLEDGNVNSARKIAAEAEQLYRDAELQAIKTAYLQDTLKMLAIVKDKYRDDVPETLAKAEQLAKEAEKALQENRYDTDRPRDLARQSNYEAKHAIFLGQTIQKMERDGKTFEDALLASEKPLRKIAASIDVVAEFDQGYDKVTGQIESYIRSQADVNAKLTQTLADRDEELKNTTARVAEMEAQLGGIAQEKTALTKQMEAQAQIRQRFATVEHLFTSEEAVVYRKADDVILRLTGLKFDSGSSVINPEYFGLLTSVEKAINAFPECTISIEGHTDSYGGDEENLQLSQERAVAVRAYLVANMNLTPTRIDARGLGESNPIANNETPEGRTRNRRIEVIIHAQAPVEMSLQ